MNTEKSQTNLDVLKVAWVRDPNAPMGKPANGKLQCNCGNAPETKYSPDQGNVTCVCGMVYTWDGWVK